MSNINLKTIDSLPLAEEVNENTSLVGWDGEKTVRVAKDMVGGVSSWNDLEDRPFGSEFETVSTMLIEEQQVTLMAPGMSYPYARTVFDVSISKEENTMFVVTLDGVKYEPKRRSSANSYSDDEGSIGNGALLNDWVNSYEPRFVDEDTGEPFGIVFDTFDSFTIYVPISSGFSKTVTLAIEQIEEKEDVKSIDPKYITGDDLTKNDNGKFIGIVDGEVELVPAPSSDPISWDDLNNKPFGTEYTYNITSLVDNISIELTKIGGYCGTNIAFDLTTDIVEDLNYKFEVMIDGTRYVTKLCSVDTTSYAFGNGAILVDLANSGNLYGISSENLNSEDTREPFAVFIRADSTAVLYMTDGNVGTHVVTIGQMFVKETIVTPISHEYLPSPLFDKLLIEDEYETVLEWDGAIDGVDTFLLDSRDFYKVSDVPLTYDECASMKYRTVFNGTASDILSVEQAWTDSSKTCFYVNDIVSCSVEGSCRFKNNTTGLSTTVTVPSKGLYFRRFNEEEYVNGLYKLTGAKCITGVVFGDGILKHDKWLLTIDNGNIAVKDIDEN